MSANAHSSILCDLLFFLAVIFFLRGGLLLTEGVEKNGAGEDDCVLLSGESLGWATK